MKFFERGWLQPKRINEGDEPTEPIESGLDVADRRPNPEEALGAAVNDSEADDEEIDLSSEEHGGPYDVRPAGPEPEEYPWERAQTEAENDALIDQQVETADSAEPKTPSQGSVEKEGIHADDWEAGKWKLKDNTTWKNSRDDQPRKAA